MTLELQKKYFHLLGTASVYAGTTEIELLRDGVAYFDAVDAAIATTLGADDAIFILAWRLDASFDLRGRTGAAAVPIGELLAAKAYMGVDVRLALWTGLTMGDPGGFPFGNPMRDNVASARTLRTLMIPGAPSPPLADRVLLDWSGAITGSHHMKSVLVVSGGGAEMVGFATGLDPWKYRRDQAPHTYFVDRDGSPFGWHDMGVRLRGGAAQGIYDNFVQRWQEASTLPNRRYGIFDAAGLSLEPFNPPAVALPVTAARAPVLHRPQQAVQVLRSRYFWKLREIFTPRRQEWNGPPGLTGGIHEVFETLTKAILAAEHYVYIEDQYLGESPSGHPDMSFSLFPHLAAAAKGRDVKVILVGSGRGDPDDPPWERGPKNLTFADVGRRPYERVGVLKKLVADDLTAFGIDPTSRLAVWRLKPATVHSKLIIIDDRFLAVGSANIHYRSMTGEDSELQVAVVDSGDLIRDFRINLWSEHFNLPLTSRPPGVQAALEDFSMAFGLWRPAWLPPGATDTWIVPDKPPGFLPAAHEMEFVGP